MKDQFPAPGAYEAKNHTIELAVRVEKEEDPDLRVKKPGFGSSMPRFSESPQRRAEEEDEDEPVAPMKHNASDLFIKKGKEHPAFNTQVGCMLRIGKTICLRRQEGAGAWAWRVPRPATKPLGQEDF